MGERGAADTHVPGAGGVEQSFLGHVRELGRGVVPVGWVVGICIGVRIDVERDEAPVTFGDCAHDGHRDRSVAADRHWYRTALNDPGVACSIRVKASRIRPGVSLTFPQSTTPRTAKGSKSACVGLNRRISGDCRRTASGPLRAPTLKGWTPQSNGSPTMAARLSGPGLP